MKGADNMKTFSSYNSEEGIEKLMNCADDIFTIMTHKEVSKVLGTGNFLKIGGEAVKNCKEEVERILDALDDHPESVIGMTAGITQVIMEVMSDKDFKDFFTFLTSKKKEIQ